MGLTGTEIPQRNNLNQKEHRKLGYFLLNMDLLRKIPIDELIVLFEPFVVIRAAEEVEDSLTYAIDLVRYVALSPLFRPIGIGEKIPRYEITFSKEIDPETGALIDWKTEATEIPDTTDTMDQMSPKIEEYHHEVKHNDITKESKDDI